jgi:MFS family permease
MLIPELPQFLSNLGGADYKGFIIGLFTITAAVSRPFSGKLVDKIGRKPIIYFGITICIICALLYPLLTTIFSFFMVRLLHGFCAGTAPTASSAILADIVPPNKRGEAMGFMGLLANIGTAISPSLGSFITNHYSLEAMFYFSCFLGFLSWLLIFFVAETLENRQALKWYHFNIQAEDVVEPSVIQPALVMFLYTIAFGAVLTISPDISQHLQIENKGLFMAFYTFGSILVRLYAGKVSDKYGRIKILRWGLALQVIALTAMGFATNATMLFACIFLYGMSMGIASPTVLAWTIDHTNNTNRGRALATSYLAMELGIGSGAFMAGWLYNNNPTMFSYTLWAAMLPSAVALGFLAYLPNASSKLANSNS